MNEWQTDTYVVRAKANCDVSHHRMLDSRRSSYSSAAPLAHFVDLLAA